ncbi:MAG: esterase [Proteobacteria bacterium]|nr:esterase [Pseudomonadota bacterium]
MPATHLLYLHGFRSSPQSAKARLVAEQVARQHPDLFFWCPQLPPSPREAMALVAHGIAAWPKGPAMAVIGSSLGGYYASWVASQASCTSVLLNPAVNPARDLARHIGEQSSWHDPEERFFFRPEFIEELEALDVSQQPPGGPELLIAAQGDELLDWREMVTRYPHATQRVLPGGDHALSDFAQHLEETLRFCSLV